MTVVLTENFTGANGSAWNAGNWTTSTTGTAGTTDVQSNAGRMLTGNSGTNYNDGQRAIAVMATTANMKVECTVLTEGALNSMQYKLFVRAAGDWPFNNAPTQAYILVLQPGDGNWVIRKFHSGNETDLATQTFAWTTATTYNVRFQVSGTSVSAKVWTGADNGVFDKTITDVEVTGSGILQLEVLNGAASGARTGTWDTLTVDDLVSAGGGGTPSTATSGGFFIPNAADAAVADQAAIDRGDVDILVAGHHGNGVISGCDVSAQATPDMTVAVNSGVVRINGTAATVTSGNLAVTSDATSPRFCLVAIDSTGAKSVVTGTAATSPVFPVIPANTVICAAVYVAAGATSIASTRMIDKRVLLEHYPTQCVTFYMDGNLTVATSVHAFRFDQFPVTIVGISARVETAPTTQAVIIDATKNGTTVFSNNAARPQIAASATNTGSALVVPDVSAAFALHDLLRINTLQIGTGTTGANMDVNVYYRRNG